MFARFYYLELQYFSNIDISKIEKYINSKSMKLVEESHIKNDLIKYLNEIKEIIEQKKRVKKLQKSAELNSYLNEIERIKNIKLDGVDDETNIQFFEFLFVNVLKDE